MKSLSGKLTYANVISTICLFLLLGGGAAFAASQVHLGKNAVGDNQLKKNAVTNAKIKNGAVTNAKIQNDAVTGAKVKDGSLTGADIDQASLTGVRPRTSRTLLVSGQRMRSGDPVPGRRQRRTHLGRGLQSQLPVVGDQLRRVGDAPLPPCTQRTHSSPRNGRSRSARGPRLPT